MSTLKFTRTEHWERIERHLADARGERFAFAFTKLLHNGKGGPVLEVVDIALIDDEEIEPNHDGWRLADTALDRIHNHAVATGRGLVEFHNHRLKPPGFSPVDERALAEMSPYAVDLLDGTPYAAAVWAQGMVRADWWRPGTDGELERKPFDTVTVLGDHITVLNAPPVTDTRFARQIPLLGPLSQATVAALRVAVVGAGGTGSHVALGLAYLGFRKVIVLDDDLVETTNLNRLVTADQADIGTPKTIVTRRRMRSIDPRIEVQIFPGLTPAGEHPELHDADLLIGCVDHDGPRHPSTRSPSTHVFPFSTSPPASMTINSLSRSAAVSSSCCPAPHA